jgi:hypothetical protein
MITTIILRFQLMKWKEKQQIKEAAKRVRKAMENS